MVALANSFIIYTKVLKNKMQLKDFHLEIFKVLISFKSIERVALMNSPTEFGHYPIKINDPRNSKRCKNKGCKKKSSYKCEICSIESNKEIPLCIDLCFKEYHINK